MIRRLYFSGLLAAAMAVMTTHARAKPVLFGPANPGAENGAEDWWQGARGGGHIAIDNTDPASGTNDFTLGNTRLDGDNSADRRSVAFPLGPAAAGAKPVTFSFAYKLTDEVKPGDNMRVQLRFFDRGTNFLSEKDFWVGSKSRDSAMNRYRTLTVAGIPMPRHARMADIRVTENFWGDHWSSGTGRFDDFRVTPTTHSMLFYAVSAVVSLGIAFLAALWFLKRKKQKA
jgi:hypothetical protein